MKRYISSTDDYPQYIRRSHPRKKLIPLSDWRYLSEDDVVIYKGAEFDGSWEIECVVKKVLPDGVIVSDLDNPPGYGEEYLIDNDTLDYFYEYQ